MANNSSQRKGVELGFAAGGHKEANLTMLSHGQ